MNRKTILPLIGAALLATLPLPASAFDLPRNGVVFQLADDEDHKSGHWRRIDGRWVSFWAVQGDNRWDDDDEDRWDDDDDDRWGDDDRWDDDDDDDEDDDDDDDGDD